MLAAATDDLKRDARLEMFCVSKIAGFNSSVWKLGNFGEYDRVQGGKGSEDVNKLLVRFVVCMDCAISNTKFCEIKRGLKGNISNLDQHLKQHHPHAAKVLNMSHYNQTSKSLNSATIRG